MQADTNARSLIIGQAAGSCVQSNGARPRKWIGFDKPTLHDPQQVAIITMSYCYPDKRASGDLTMRNDFSEL